MQAFLVCEGVGRSPEGKITLYGIFDRVNITDMKRQFALNAYAKVAGYGSHRFVFDVVDKSGQSILGEDQATPTFDANLKSGSMQAHVHMPVVFKKTGVYDVVLKAGRKTLSTYPLQVAQSPTK